MARDGFPDDQDDYPAGEPTQYAAYTPAPDDPTGIAPVAPDAPTGLAPAARGAEAAGQGAPDSGALAWSQDDGTGSEPVPYTGPDYTGPDYTVPQTDSRPT
ncbi:MAG: hypothetical protein WCJ98_10100, partial [Mycobacteriaceae bacterium]